MCVGGFCSWVSVKLSVDLLELDLLISLMNLLWCSVKDMLCMVWIGCCFGEVYLMDRFWMLSRMLLCFMVFIGFFFCVGVDWRCCLC